MKPPLFPLGLSSGCAVTAYLAWSTDVLLAAVCAVLSLALLGGMLLSIEPKGVR